VQLAKKGRMPRDKEHPHTQNKKKRSGNEQTALDYLLLFPQNEARHVQSSFPVSFSSLGFCRLLEY
jgi:hypothetical protein